jgi:hypothetical protein
MMLTLGLDALQGQAHSDTVFTEWPQWARTAVLTAAMLALILVLLALPPVSTFIYQDF